MFDVSEGQLDALAGSDTLIAEVVTQGEHRASDKSMQRASARLLAALTSGDTPEQRLAMPLLVLLAQQRKLIVLQSQVGGSWTAGGLCVAEQRAGDASRLLVAPQLVCAPPTLAPLTHPLPPTPLPSRARPAPGSPPTSS